MTVAIVGAGLSGSLLAALLAVRGRDAVLVERSGVFGLGLAYSTTNDSHRLNVRSGRMSALADDPGHFVRWLDQTGHWDADPNAFAPRRVYGLYVQDLLAEVEAGAPGQILRVIGNVVSVSQDSMILADGREINADQVVLATGNPAPQTAGVTAGVIADAWSPGALDGIGPDDDVVILGSGLTMIDVVLELEDRGWRGRAVAISRRGLLPRSHDVSQSHPSPRHPADAALSQRMRAFRARADEIGWGVAMDELRSLNAELWAELDQVARARFLRHLRPWWDVHRHRIATDVARRIEALTQRGQLVVHAGRLETITPVGDGVEVLWRPRGLDRAEATPARALIDCTGPGVDPTRSTDALTRHLLATGQAGIDPLRLGLSVDRQGRLLNTAGHASERIHVLGPPSRAAVWEIVAVPDIRQQVQALASLLAKND